MVHAIPVNTQYCYCLIPICVPDAKKMTLTFRFQIADVNETLSSTEIPLVYPSSNDSSLLVLRPAIVNLGSQSSKCTEIRTPQDPDKISMIDNKKMSISIGVIGGLVVFALIILIIVVKPNTKDTEEGPDESLAIGAPKTGQNEVPLIFTGPAIVSRSGGPFGSSAPAAPAHTSVASVRHSRANSVSSVHKISVADGPDTGTGKLKKNQVNRKTFNFFIPSNTSCFTLCFENLLAKEI